VSELLGELLSEPLSKLRLGKLSELHMGSNLRQPRRAVTLTAVLRGHGSNLSKARRRREHRRWRLHSWRHLPLRVQARARSGLLRMQSWHRLMRSWCI
jgi:hypothetical protein